MLTADMALSADEAEQVMGRVRDAAAFLKALSHEDRLMILCHLAAGEKPVGELQDLMSIRQTTVSQHLMRLRQEGLVSARRDGRSVYYSLANETSKRILGALYDTFCGPSQE